MCPALPAILLKTKYQLNGISFRFIDTAGLRETPDKVEAIGVERTLKKVEEAALVLYLFDVQTTTPAQLQLEIEALKLNENTALLAVANKIDALPDFTLKPYQTIAEIIAISAVKTRRN